MRVRDISVGTRFFLGLAFLVAAAVATALLGVTGLSSVDRANRQVFEDNFRTSLATSLVASDLARVEALSLESIEAPNNPTAEGVRAQLHQITIPATTASVAVLVRMHAGDPRAEYAQIERIRNAWQAFLPLAQTDPLSPGAGRLSAAERSAAASTVQARLDPLIARVSARQSVETTAAAAAHDRARHTFTVTRFWLIVAAAMALLAAATMIRLGLTFKRLVEIQAEAQDHGVQSNEYTETLQATENEGEAQELLRRQIQRTQPGTRAIVLGRNNSADRLEARTSLVELDELREPLEHATPRSCLAVRFARGHSEGGSRVPLTNCELCGKLAPVSTCEPLLVSGVVIGSVLVIHAEPPDALSRRRIRETVNQAAPVLGNLRNLAIAELRASTDRLTGLPNQRAVQDTLKRMVAQASRTITPLTAVLLDLDHFKQINDFYGHDSGDEVLAAVGVAMRLAMRESDFVGRYGGEEFLMLLPSTDTDGAIQVTEAVRAAIGAIRVPAVDRQVTASAGVATPSSRRRRAHRRASELPCRRCSCCSHPPRARHRPTAGAAPVSRRSSTRGCASRVSG
jgi:diguanylate cyclase (GGDEF)-like protein